MENRKFGALTSSANPAEMSATVTGVIKAVAGILVMFGFTTTVEVDQAIEAIGILVSSGYVMWGAGEATFGLVRKIILRIVNK